jgi:predicted ribosome-associated RNA-binding protein Tma20
MKSQETLSKIMSILNLSEDQVKVAAAQATLENGTVLEAEAFESGNEVFIVSEEERVAVPVGEYEMEDGRILVVAEEGIIGEIREGGEEEAPEEAPAGEEAPAEEVEAAEEEMNYVTREELAEVVNEIKAMVEQMMSEKEEKMAAEAKEKLSKAKPARKPMKHSPETKAKPQVNLGQSKKGGSTLDRVMAKISE